MDCYLVAGPVNCQALKDAFFASIPYLRETTTADGVDVLVTIRNLELDRRYEYVITFTGTGDRPSFRLVERSISKTTSADGALTILESVMQKGVAPYLDVVAAASTEHGVTTLLLQDPSRRPGAPNQDTTGWYVTMEGAGTFQSGTTSLISLDGTSETNYSDARWRLNLRSLVNLQRVDVRFGDDQRETVSATFLKQRACVARSVSGHWSVGAIGTFAHDSTNNLVADAKVEGGIEWDLAPILKTNDHSLGTRYVVGLEHQKYIDANILGRYRSTFAEHAIAGYLTWHLANVDVSGDVTASSPVDDLRFAAASANLALVWRLTERLSTSLSATAAYRYAIINEPVKTPENGLSQLISGGNYAPLTYGSTLSVLYTFGNSGLNRQDQRWRASSSASSTSTQ